MKTITRTLHKCDFCGFEDEREDFMKLHEECCALNPKNQPCSQCGNMILGVGCGRGMNIESVGGHVLCFYYNEGVPINPFEEGGIGKLLEKTTIDSLNNIFDPLGGKNSDDDGHDEV